MLSLIGHKQVLNPRHYHVSIDLHGYGLGFMNQQLVRQWAKHLELATVWAYQKPSRNLKSKSRQSQGIHDDLWLLNSWILTKDKSYKFKIGLES